VEALRRETNASMTKHQFALMSGSRRNRNDSGRSVNPQPGNEDRAPSLWEMRRRSGTATLPAGVERVAEEPGRHKTVGSERSAQASIHEGNAAAPLQARRGLAHALRAQSSQMREAPARPHGT